MTPNDLYSDCVPRRQKKKATQNMFFPLVERPSIGRPTVAQEQRARRASVKARKRQVMPYRILAQLAVRVPAEKEE